MSWTETFPYLSDDMITEYDAHATSAEKAELEDWLGVARVSNRQPGKRHIVSTTPNPRSEVVYFRAGGGCC